MTPREQTLFIRDYNSRVVKKRPRTSKIYYKKGEKLIIDYVLIKDKTGQYSYLYT